jgi:hypothetical protein
MAPVGNRLLGEMHRAFWEFDDNAVDLHKPYRPPILHQSGSVDSKGDTSVNKYHNPQEDNNVAPLQVSLTGL